jgi:hypothetical protein
MRYLLIFLLFQFDISVSENKTDTAAGWETRQVLSHMGKLIASPHQPAFKYPLKIAPAEN